MLDLRQRYLLRNKACQKVGNPTEFTKTGLKLESGESLEAGTVIFCTGYSSGIEEISTEKDGKPFKMELNKKLFEHLIGET